jgi:hypothetical protein
MKAAKFTFFRRVTAFCPSAALMLAVLVLIVAATTVAAQTQVFVPGTASGGFGTPALNWVPLVPALTVTGPGTITVTYISGTVTDAGGVNTGPNGVPYSTRPDWQLPLEEKVGVTRGMGNNLDALIGVFVPATRVNRAGFAAVDGTKALAAVGILPNGLFFIGTSKTFKVNQAGTLFLGINDQIMGDNGGGFTVAVTGP